MSTSSSIHGVTDVTAYHYAEIPSLTLEIHTDWSRAPHTIILFTDDAELNARLVEAINTVARQRAEEKSIAQSEPNDTVDYNHRPDDEEVIF